MGKKFNLSKDEILNKVLKNHKAIADVTDMLLRTNKVKLDEPIGVTTQLALFSTKFDLDYNSAHLAIEQVKDTYLQELLTVHIILSIHCLSSRIYNNFHQTIRLHDLHLHIFLHIHQMH